MYALKAAKEYGYSIAIAAPDDGEYAEIFKKFSDEYININLKPYSIRSLFVLKKYILSHDIQLVHSHGKGAGLYSRPLKILCSRIRVVHTFHGIYVEKYGLFLRSVYLLGERVLKHFTNAFICVSESEAQNALDLKIAEESRCHVVNNGVDTSIFLPHQIAINSYRNQFGIADDEFVIGCVARFDVDKGHDYLIPAFREFLSIHQKSRLILVGDGPERGKVEKLVKENGVNEQVIFAGVRKDIPDFLQLFNIFVSASLKEGMPYTLIEAMATGISIVATNVIGNKDVITDGVTGVLVASKNSHAICEGLNKVYSDDKLAERFRKNGPIAVQQSFSVNESERKLFNIYDQML